MRRLLSSLPHLDVDGRRFPGNNEIPADSI
jgi:hypothetical protein